MSKLLIAVILMLSLACYGVAKSTFHFEIVGTSRDDLAPLLVGSQFTMRGEVISYKYCNQHNMNFKTGVVTSTKMMCAGVRRFADYFITSVLENSVESFKDPKVSADNTFRLKDKIKEWIDIQVMPNVEKDDVPETATPVVEKKPAF